MEFILNPWPWYVSGPLITLVMVFLLLFGKSFGMSSNLRTFCAIGGAGKYSDFFKIDWHSYKWNLIVVIGAIIGGYIATQFLSTNSPIDISTNTIADLKELGFSQPTDKLLPPELFLWKNILTFKGISILCISGFLVGFGTRYAGGCTSGHAISGLSNLQIPSLLAVVGFFIGGLLMTHVLFPLIF